MSRAVADAIGKALLYEGYLLYPYRPSARKNRQRFNFGVVYPRCYAEARGELDAWSTQTECLVFANSGTTCEVRVRFLRLVERSIGKLAVPVRDLRDLDECTIEKVERLEAAGRTYHGWQEAREEEIAIAEFCVTELVSQPIRSSFLLDAKRDKEAIRDGNGEIAGVIVREQDSVQGTIELSATALSDGLFRFTAVISNSTNVENCEQCTREEALRRSLVSTHSVLELRDGEFVSLIDPPEELRSFATACRNVGTWPVLIGDEGRRDTMLSSPIILYDYPTVAPESPGNLFDAAEIDEILSLRILTMTENEKTEARESDDRAREILERTENLPEEHWMKLHGALRGLRPARGEKS
jgi:hypothetical protein